MPVTITKTIKSAGGDYSSRSAWEAAQQGDLVALDEIHQGEIYNFNDTTALLVDGSTSDATRYMRLFVAAGEGHAGIFSASKARITGGPFGAALVDIFDSLFRYEGDQVNHTTGGSGAYNILARSPSVFLSKIISKGSTGGSGIRIQSTDGVIENTLQFDAAGSGIQVADSSSTMTCRNCTSIDNGGRGFFNNFAAATGSTLIECLGYSNTTADFGVDGVGRTFAATYCASSDATADDWGGTGNRISQTFTFVDEAGDDFALASGDAGAKDFGNTTGTPSDDVVGTSRPQGTNRDIGFFEVVAAAGGHPAIRRFSQTPPSALRQHGGDGVRIT